MRIVAVELFVSLALVAAGLVSLAWSLRQGDHEHADRLSLLPIEDDEPARSAPDPGALP